MDWKPDSDQSRDYQAVTSGGGGDPWFRTHQDRILDAAMGQGSPRDYSLALERAARSGKVKDLSQAGLQAFCDTHLRIGCSEFVTNYLISIGRLSSLPATVRITIAASYFDRSRVVRDPTSVRQGDLLVWMDGDRVKRNPGHVAVVESYVAASVAAGNLRVVEATVAAPGDRQLVESPYTVEQISASSSKPEVMVLVVRRFGRSGHRVAWSGCSRGRLSWRAAGPLERGAQRAVVDACSHIGPGRRVLRAAERVLAGVGETPQPIRPTREVARLSGRHVWPPGAPSC